MSDNNLLELLEDEEIKIVLAHMDINGLLNPIKNNQKTYSQQVKKLGRMDAKSPLVQKVLPGMVFTLVKREDSRYSEILSKNLSRIKNKFEDFVIDESSSKNLSHDVPESYADLFWSYKEKCDDTCDLQYFWILLKLSDDILKVSEKERIQYYIKQQGKQVQLAEEHQHQMFQMKQDCMEEIERLKREHAKEVKELKQEIHKQKDLIQDKKNTLEQSWEKEVEDAHVEKILALNNEYSRKKEHLESRYRNLEDEAEMSYQERIKSLSAETEELTHRLETEYQDKKTYFEDAVRDLKAQTERLQNIKATLQTEIDVLARRKNELQAYIDTYFEKFEEHAVQLNLDKILQTKFAELAYVRDNSAENNIVNNDTNGIYIYGGKHIENSEFVDQAEDLEDILSDLSDNISIYFDDAYEIAKLLIAIYGTGKAMLIDSASAIKIGDCLAAIVDGKTAIVFDLNEGIYHLQELVRSINEREERVIIIKGLIDRFDDKALTSICNNCSDKIIIFSFLEKKILSMISKTYFQYTIPLYLEDKIIFQTEEMFIVSRQKIDDYLPKVKMEDCRTIYKKYFSKLRNMELISNNTALVLSEFTCRYSEVSGGGNISDLIKNVISFAIEDYEQSEDAQKFLEELKTV